MNSENPNYRFINKFFTCTNCQKYQKSLVEPDKNTSTCKFCNSETLEITPSEFNRENVDRTYRITFNKDDPYNKEYHPKNDIFKRDVNNKNNPQTNNNNTNNNYNRNSNSQFNINNNNIPNTNTNTNTNNINSNTNRENQRFTRQNNLQSLINFPFFRTLSPFNGNVNHHFNQNEDRFMNSFLDFFIIPSVSFFNDNYASNFNSNFTDPMQRIIFISTINFREGNKNQAASSESLKNLKRFNMNKEYSKQKDDGEIEFPTCSICLIEEKEGEECILVPCGHIFHDKCVSKWFEVNCKCPLCRYDIEKCSKENK
jgi:hypothetical protein